MMKEMVVMVFVVMVKEMIVLLVVRGDGGETQYISTINYQSINEAM